MLLAIGVIKILCFISVQYYFARKVHCVSSVRIICSHRCSLYFGFEFQDNWLGVENTDPRASLAIISKMAVPRIGKKQNA